MTGWKKRGLTEAKLPDKAHPDHEADLCSWFFHADPHPGNIFVLPDNVLCYIDFGMMGRLDLETRERFADLIMSIVHRDEREAAKALLRLTLSEEEPDYPALQRDTAGFMDKHCYRPLKDVELGPLLHQFMEMAKKHRLGIPPDLFLMIKALSTVEGLGRALDPIWMLSNRPLHS